jgi:hydrogenase nickel incorporation protein HypB
MSRIAEIRQNVLKKNDLLAADLRSRFAAARVTVINLVSSPGAGKTALLESTLRLLQPRHRVAALVGDLATDRDAQRLNRTASRVQQITTGTVCHLDAEMVCTALTGWPLDEIDFLFIENVGNLVCPASYDIGETLRAVLLSVTEGEDKPLKYPTIFNSADLAVITKMDLAEATAFRRDEAHANIREVAPACPVCEVSSRTGEGMDVWLRRLTHLRESATWGLTLARTTDAALL